MRGLERPKRHYGTIVEEGHARLSATVDNECWPSYLGLNDSRLMLTHVEVTKACLIGKKNVLEKIGGTIQNLLAELLLVTARQVHGRQFAVSEDQAASDNVLSKHTVLPIVTGLAPQNE